MAPEDPARAARLRVHMQALRLGRRIGIAIAGAAVLGVGVLGTVLPVLPGFPLILLGLAILSLEFTWARAWLVRLKMKVAEWQQRWRRWRSRRQ